MPQRFAIGGGRIVAVATQIHHAGVEGAAQLRRVELLGRGQYFSAVGPSLPLGPLPRDKAKGLQRLAQPASAADALCFVDARERVKGLCVVCSEEIVNVRKAGLLGALSRPGHSLFHRLWAVHQMLSSAPLLHAAYRRTVGRMP